MNILRGYAVCIIIFQSIISCRRRHDDRWKCRRRCEKPRRPRRDSSESSSSSENHHPHHDTSTRIDQHIQLIQNVILQATINIEQCTKYYTEELKTLLVEGLGIINRNYLSKISKDFKRLEANILEVVTRVNEDILRDTETLVINSNEELQDAVISRTKETNKKIITDFDGIIIAPPAAGPDPAPIAPVSINKEEALAIIQRNFAELIERGIQVFRRVTNIEKALLHKIIKEKKNQEVRAITKLIDEFEKHLCSQFRDLICENESFVHNSIVENTHKFVVALECLFNKIGQNIISVLKGCEVNFRPVVGINTSSLIKSKSTAVPSYD